MKENAGLDGSLASHPLRAFLGGGRARCRMPYSPTLAGLVGTDFPVGASVCVCVCENGSWL